MTKYSENFNFASKFNIQENTLLEDDEYEHNERLSEDDTIGVT